MAKVTYEFDESSDFGFVDGSSDMLTVIDKLDYKRKNNIPFTKAETFFFRGKDFRHIINLLKNKRI